MLKSPVAFRSNPIETAPPTVASDSTETRLPSETFPETDSSFIRKAESVTDNSPRVSTDSECNADDRIRSPIISARPETVRQDPSMRESDIEVIAPKSTRPEEDSSDPHLTEFARLVNPATSALPAKEADTPRAHAPPTERAPSIMLVNGKPDIEWSITTAACTDNRCEILTDSPIENWP